MANDSANLNKAKNQKNDEFYTQYTDIEKELIHYSDSLFNGKVVYCNCDNPHYSQFVQFFINNFHKLHLKKLLASCYVQNNISLFDDESEFKHGLYLEYNGEENTDINSLIKELKGDGDYRSYECLNMLKESDIVVTNPPFSLFRSFLSTLVQYKNSFIILGTINAVSYKECFDLIKDNKLWLGASIHSGDIEFAVPQNYKLDLNNAKRLSNGDLKTKTGRIDVNGNKFIRVKGIRWFTNMENNYKPQLKLSAENIYIKSKYPNYDNYTQAIEVSKTKDIPIDYYGIMGVPITFLDYYNSDLYQIVGSDRGLPKGRCYINGQRLYSRIFIKRKNKTPQS